MILRNEEGPATHNDSVKVLKAHFIGAKVYARLQSGGSVTGRVSVRGRRRELFIGEKNVDDGMDKIIFCCVIERDGNSKNLKF